MISLSQNADIYSLYERSVQCAEAEIDFVADTFQTLKGRPPNLLREDFCGTASVCVDWVQRGKTHTAVGIDLDAPVLAWARQHHLTKLDQAQQARLQLLQADVLTAQTTAADMVLAMNFSYWLFKQRAELLAYFRTAHANLVADGILFLDAYGGYDSFRECVEEREIDDDQGSFTYIWEQADFNPVNNHFTGYIHFRFADASEIKPAFTYDWRFYTLPEIRELLFEAGFRKVTVYWQGWDADGEPDSEFKPVTKAEADAAWICYLAAEK